MFVPLAADKCAEVTHGDTIHPAQLVRPIARRPLIGAAGSAVCSASWCYRIPFNACPNSCCEHCTTKTRLRRRGSGGGVPCPTQPCPTQPPSAQRNPPLLNATPLCPTQPPSAQRNPRDKKECAHMHACIRVRRGAWLNATNPTTTKKDKGHTTKNYSTGTPSRASTVGI